MIFFFENLFFFALILIQLPPFFFISRFLNIHTLAKLIFAFLFFYNILLNKNLKEILKKYKAILFFFILFFASQSISIFNVINVTAFWQRYEEFLFTSFVLFLLFIYLKKGNVKKTVCILFLGFASNSLFQFLIYFYPKIFIQLGGMFIHPDLINLIAFKIQSGQLFFDSYDEILIPFIFYYFSQTKENKNKIGLIAPIFIIGFFSFISNFRTRFLMFIFAVFFSCILFFKRLKKFFPILLISSFIFLNLIYRLQISSLGFSVVERFLLTDKADYSSIVSRVERWKKSVEIGFSSPIVGVGLGNYYDHLTNFEQHKFSLSLFPQEKKVNEIMNNDPLNIFFTTFGETGFIGLFSFFLLIFYFIKEDLKKINNGNKISRIFIISFWTLFINSFLDPSYIIKYQILWWTLRVIIEKFSVAQKQKIITLMQKKLIRKCINSTA